MGSDAAGWVGGTTWVDVAVGSAGACVGRETVGDGNEVAWSAGCVGAAIGAA